MTIKKKSQSRSPIYKHCSRELAIIACPEEHTFGGNGYTYYIALKAKWHNNNRRIEDDEIISKDWKTLLPQELREIAINTYVCSLSHGKVIELLNGYGFQVTEWNFNK